jgi:hypothetical protein
MQSDVLKLLWSLDGKGTQDYKHKRMLTSGKILKCHQYITLSALSASCLDPYQFTIHHITTSLSVHNKLLSKQENKLFKPYKPQSLPQAHHNISQACFYMPRVHLMFRKCNLHNSHYNKLSLGESIIDCGHNNIRETKYLSEFLLG